MQALNFCMVAASALMIWRCIMIVCNTEAPIVVVLSGSMEPSMYRGDILVLYKKDQLKIGDTIVYQIENEKIPIVHRISSLQDVRDTKDKTKLNTMYLTKGDNNPVDDRGLYPRNRMYLGEKEYVGHVLGSIPYSGFLTLLMTDYPYLKYSLIFCMFLSVLVSKDPS